MIKRLWILFALTIATPAALLADQVTMQLTAPPPGPSLANVYISPYTALIGAANETPNSKTGLIAGTSTLVICDDFTTDVSVATPPWQAISTNLASLQGEATGDTTLKFEDSNAAAQQYDYTVAAYLAVEILQAQQLGTPAGLQEEGDLSFALWGLFDPNSVDPNGPLSGHWVTGSDLTNAKNDLTAAELAVTNGNLTPSSYSNVTIYTPTTKSASQEYIVVTAAPPGQGAPIPSPESGTCGLLIIGIGLLLAMRKRIAQGLSQTA